MRAICVFLSARDCVKNETFMKIAVITLLIVLTAATALKQIAHNLKSREKRSRIGICSSVLLLSSALALLADLAAGPSCGPYLILSLMPPLTGMSLLTSSIWDVGKVWKWTMVAVGADVLFAVLHVLCAAGVLEPLPDSILVISVACLLMLECGLFFSGIYLRIRSVRKVMKTGTVWANVGLGIDAFYLLTGIMMVMIYFSVCFLSGSAKGPHAALAALFLGMMLVAYGVRVLSDSMFLLWRKQEQRIVESLKVTSVGSASDMSRIDEVYKDIYERVVAYFEREKPFLDCELTINDLVKVLYSNKLYISRAISQFTGRNFCQFVNYYRIKYSTECFKANHDLKIHELSSMSGFNSIVTFNMAFRLYMGENPSDWCRKEKGRFVKDKK